jgi:hypothetical protein
MYRALTFKGRTIEIESAIVMVDRLVSMKRSGGKNYYPDTAYVCHDSREEAIHLYHKIKRIHGKPRRSLLSFSSSAHFA